MLDVTNNLDVERIIFFHSGEFGIVYKAKLGLLQRVVAVKTLKGKLFISILCSI